MKPAHTDDAAIRLEASDWVSRRDRGLARDEEIRFESWRATSPRHAEIYSEVETAWRMLDRPRQSGGGEFRDRLRTLERRSRRRRLLTAATVVGAIGLVAVIGPKLLNRAAPADIAAVANVVKPGKQILNDGSIIEFGPGTQYQVAFEAAVRRVRLQSGEAHFEVAKDSARPFVVEANGVAVLAVGTAFAVQLKAESVNVLVTEGKVAVARAGEVEHPSSALAMKPNTAVMGAGDHLVVPTENETISIPSPSPTTAAQRVDYLAWRIPRLIFRDTTLDEAVALFNGHNSLRMKVESGSVGALRVTGAFRADNVEGFVRLLHTTLEIQADRNGETEIVLKHVR